MIRFWASWPSRRICRRRSRTTTSSLRSAAGTSMRNCLKLDGDGLFVMIDDVYDDVLEGSIICGMTGLVVSRSDVGQIVLSFLIILGFLGSLRGFLHLPLLSLLRSPQPSDVVDCPPVHHIVLLHLDKWCCTISGLRSRCLYQPKAFVLCLFQALR